MKAAGMKTAHSTSAIAISAPPTSSILLIAASRGRSPASMLRSTFSTTTIASSTTMPTASTSPNKVRLFSVKPNIAITKNVPISEIGIAISGISAARQVCRKMMTTMTTSRIASRIVSCTAFTDSWMNCVGS